MLMWVNAATNGGCRLKNAADKNFDEYARSEDSTVRLADGFSSSFGFAFRCQARRCFRRFGRGSNNPPALARPNGFSRIALGRTSNTAGFHENAPISSFENSDVEVSCSAAEWRKAKREMQPALGIGTSACSTSR